MLKQFHVANHAMRQREMLAASTGSFDTAPDLPVPPWHCQGGENTLSGGANASPEISAVDGFDRNGLSVEIVERPQVYRDAPVCGTERVFVTAVHEH